MKVTFEDNNRLVTIEIKDPLEDSVNNSVDLMVDLLRGAGFIEDKIYESIELILKSRRNEN